MSWLNNSLSSLKGQITTFAQEVLAETGPEEELNPVEVWEETQRKNNELTALCVAKESEIASLRKQISDLLAKNTDNGRSSKSAIDKNASLEDSWCWEPENIPSESSSKNDHERVSESSSGGGDLIAIPLDGGSSHDHDVIEKYQRILDERDNKLKRVTSENSALFAKITKLTDENVELHSNLEELDNQHNAAMKEVLNLKNDWQNKWNLLNGQHKALSQDYELKVGSVQKDYDALQKKFESIQSAYTLYVQENEVLKLELEKAVGDVKIMEVENQKLCGIQDDYAKVVDELESLKVHSKKIEDQKAELQVKLVADNSKKCKVEDDFIVLQEDDIPHPENNFEQKCYDLIAEKEQIEYKLVALQEELKNVEENRESVRSKLELKIEKLTNDVDLMKASQMANSVDDKELENYKTQISELTETIKKCEANASDVESKLMLENVNLQKQLIDLESSINKRNTETGNNNDNVLNLDDINQLISSYTKIDLTVIDKSSLESVFKSIADKIWKVEILEKNLKELSDEVLRLKEEKSSIDHERSTLQADIEHYEVECAELMKNNEILLNELENYKRNKLETIHENNEEGVDVLEKQLEESNSYLRKLEEQYNETVEKLIQADEKRYEFEDHIEGLQESNAELTYEIKTLKKQVETLESDKSNLIFEINEMKTDDKKSAVEMEILEYKNKNDSLQTQFEQLSKEHAELLTRQNFEHDPQLSVQLENLNRVVESLNSEKNAIENEMKILQSETKHYELKYLHLKDDNEMLRKELEEMQTKASGVDNNVAVEKLSKKLDEAKSNAEFVEDRFNEISQKVADLELLNNELKLELAAQQDNNTNLMAELGTLKTQIEGLEAEKSNLIIEMNEMRTDDEKSEVITRTKLLEYESSVANLEAQLDRLSKDHADLVAAMQTQKANFIDNRKKSEEKIANLEKEVKAKYESEYTTDKKLKETQQQVEQQYHVIDELKQKLLAAAQSNNNNDDHTITELNQTVDTLTQEKANLIATLTTKHNENTQYYMEIQRLGQVLQTEIEKSQTALANCENCRQLQATVAQKSSLHQSEIDRLRDQINFLKEKSDILTSNLMSEQTNQKLLQQEKSELAEQNSSLRKDLDRLREHLVELEEAHTGETLEMQKSIDETKAKMLSLQNEVSNSSNAYTSASIRANQHAETLQAQYLLLTQQRDEYAAKLSAAEDKESRNQAALVNLQCALEQFQKEKEDDIKSATQRIRKEMLNEQDKQQQLQAEMKSLQKQLAEANQGLLAAARISDQLEISQVTIAALKDEITKQQNKVEVLDGKLQATQQSQEDKVEKNLVKSMLIGYIVSSNQNDKNQILKLITTILDFTQSETDRIGLNKTQGGWLTGILQGGSAQQSGAHNKDSLAQAFVSFLEKESLPRHNAADMPNLLNISNDSKVTPSASGNSTTTQPTRKLSEQSNSSNSGPVQPILLNENVLEQFAPTRNSSSILKDILSDS